MRELKFREYLPDVRPDKFHYWGFINGTFISPANPKNKQDQFTGLCDKNGKEIYEGDLVAEINHIIELTAWGIPLIVEFGQFVTDKDSWGLSHSTTGFILKYNDDSIAGLHDQPEGYAFRASDLMVIGNIYENRELLKS